MARQLNESDLKRWMAEKGPQLIVLSTGICRDRHRAEEIVQEAFIKLWRQPPDAGAIAYASWLRRVVTNLSINALQRTKRPSALPEGSADKALGTTDRPESLRQDVEDLTRVRAAMDKLDPGKRAILMLRAREQLSYDEIAEHLAVPVGTVMSRLNRARRALMDEIKRQDAEHGRNDEAAVFDFKRYANGA